MRLHGTRQDLHVVDGEKLAVMGDDLAGPACAHQRKGFIMAPTAFISLDTECTLFRRVDSSESDCGKESTS
jgi:hypothetical protein